MASARKYKKSGRSGTSDSGVREAVEQITGNEECLSNFIDEFTDELEDATNCDEDELGRDPAKLDQAIRALMSQDKSVEGVFSDMEEEEDSGAGVDWTQYDTAKKRKILAAVVKTPRFRQALLNELND